MQRDSKLCYWLCVTIHLATYTLVSRQIRVRLTNVVFFAGVDNWSRLHTKLVSLCPDFTKDSEACRKKWSAIYNDYKEDKAMTDMRKNGMSLVESLKANDDVKMALLMSIQQTIAKLVDKLYVASYGKHVTTLRPLGTSPQYMPLFLLATSS